MSEKTLYFQSPRLLSELYCFREDNLATVERALTVKLVTRENWLNITGSSEAVTRAESFFNILNKGRAQGLAICNADFHNTLRGVANGNVESINALLDKPLVIQVKNRSIVPKTVNQKHYLKSMQEHEVVFAIGPAGTGKTYLAMVTAIDALMREEVKQLILTRPAVEAGEALGFLPGDLTEKIQPYLTPLYDAMFDILGRERAQKLIERGIVEIAPLAYMRGRTLSNAYIILDEAQNTTAEQMMMCLTRMGDLSRMVITGDITQIDLPRKKSSGLKQAIEILSDVDTIAFVYLHADDVVRHPVVQRIIDAYTRFHAAFDGEEEERERRQNVCTE